VNLKIESISRRAVGTKNGPRDVWSLMADDGDWYSSFIGRWNRDWQVGQVITLSDDQVVENSSNGRVFRNIKPPRTASRATPAETGEVLKALRILYKDIQLVKAKLGIAEVSRE
jgi:hypothetical protein